MKSLQEHINEQLIDESRGLWVIEIQPKHPEGQYQMTMMEVCSSLKAAQVWCVECSATYPAWKEEWVDKGKNKELVGLWNEKTGDKLVIKQRNVYDKEKTELKPNW